VCEGADALEDGFVVRVERVDAAASDEGQFCLARCDKNLEKLHTSASFLLIAHSITPPPPPVTPIKSMSQAKEVRRANIDGRVWLEMEMLPPHAMAGSRYYATPASFPSALLFFQQKYFDALTRCRANTPLLPCLTTLKHAWNVLPSLNSMCAVAPSQSTYTYPPSHTIIAHNYFPNLCTYEHVVQHRF